jgi:hypothetical protein
MASLSGLKADLTPTYNRGLTTFYVYNQTLSVTDAGKLCTWTVPDGVKNVTFELWGGGGAGAGARCCQATAYTATGGMYTTRTISTTPGCTYNLCAGGSSTCSSACQGCQGCVSYVTGSGIATTCAAGGQGGTTACYYHYGCSCCRGCQVWTGGAGDYCQPATRGTVYTSNGCLASRKDMMGSTFEIGTMNVSKTYCLNTPYCDACFFGYGNFPAGPGNNAMAMSGVCKCGNPGMGGLIKVTYG